MDRYTGITVTDTQVSQWLIGDTDSDHSDSCQFFRKLLYIVVTLSLYSYCILRDKLSFQSVLGHFTTMLCYV